METISLLVILFQLRNQLRGKKSTFMEAISLIQLNNFWKTGREISSIYDLSFIFIILYFLIIKSNLMLIVIHYLV